MCQLHMRTFRDGDTIYIEPWRSRAFPVIKDLVVNRGALDRIIASGGFISAPTGSAQDANSILVPKQDADGENVDDLLDDIPQDVLEKLIKAKDVGVLKALERKRVLEEEAQNHTHGASVSEN